VPAPARQIPDRISVFWPSWEWISHPARRWLFASYAESLAVLDNVKARRLIQSAWYQENWGGRFQFAGDQNQKHRIENDCGGHRIAIGVNGSGTGEGGDRLVIDDRHNLNDFNPISFAGACSIGSTRCGLRVAMTPSDRHG
jgi:hypothetical protein